LKDIVIETQRTLIRPMEPGDLEALIALWCDPEVMKYCGGPADPARIGEIIAYNSDNFERHGNAVFAVLRKTDRKLVGIAGCKLDKGNTGRGEYICHLAKEIWGQGYAAEIARAYIAWVKERGNMDLIYASVMPDNTASIRLTQKCGFIQKGFVQFEDTGFVDEPYFELKLSDGD
jgi:RimJ/RimL family protein N-acetyltransferase